MGSGFDIGAGSYDGFASLGVGELLSGVDQNYIYTIQGATIRRRSIKSGALLHTRTMSGTVMCYTGIDNVGIDTGSRMERQDENGTLLNVSPTSSYSSTQKVTASYYLRYNIKYNWSATIIWDSGYGLSRYLDKYFMTQTGKVLTRDASSNDFILIDGDAETASRQYFANFYTKHIIEL